MQIRNLRTLNKVMENNIKTALKNKIAIKVKELIAYYLQKNFYDYTPAEYERTYELRDSLTIGDVIKTSSGYKVEVFFDSNKIQPHYETVNDPFPQHLTPSGEDVSDKIAFWAENALINPVSFRGERRGFFVANTVRDLKRDKAHVKELIAFLRSQGIKAKIRW